MKKKIKKQIDTEITNLNGGKPVDRSDRKPRNQEERDPVMKTEMSDSDEEERKPLHHSLKKSLAGGEEEEIERPRSNSEPNLVLIPEPSMEYQYDTSRNFQEELEIYFSKRA